MPAQCPAQCLIHPKHFYFSCILDAFPYHLGSIISPTEAYLVPIADLHSAVDSAVAIWQQCLGELERGCSSVGISSICSWERSAPCPLACAPLINSPRNGDTAETHHSWKQTDSLLLCSISLDQENSTTWTAVQLLAYNGFPSRGPAGISALAPREERSLMLKESHRK